MVLCYALGLRNFKMIPALQGFELDQQRTIYSERAAIQGSGWGLALHEDKRFNGVTSS
jgi:hypothetical protein